MKFRFANGHSINIWDTEYDRITVFEGTITCIRPGGKVAVIEVPKEWFEGSWSRPETLPLRDCSVETASVDSGKIRVQGAKAPNGQTSVSVRCGAKRKFENTERIDALFVKLTDQIEALRRDLVQFSSETKEKMEPLLALPLDFEIFGVLTDDIGVEAEEM